MKKAYKKRVPAEFIAREADKAKNVSRYFTNKGKMMPPLQRVHVGLTRDMLSELDEAARELNISREAVIKVLIRQALDHHHLAHRSHHGK